MHHIGAMGPAVRVFPVRGKPDHQYPATRLGGLSGCQDQDLVQVTVVPAAAVV